MTNIASQAGLISHRRRTSCDLQNV